MGAQNLSGNFLLLSYTCFALSSTEPCILNQRFTLPFLQGTLTNETRCLRCETITARDETFLDLSLDIEQNSSITSCLRNFSSTETLNAEDKFFCDKCCRCVSFLFTWLHAWRNLGVSVTLFLYGHISYFCFPCNLVCLVNQGCALDSKLVMNTQYCL